MRLRHLFLLMVASVAGVSPAVNAVQSTAQPAVVQVERTSRGVSHRVNSTVANETATGNLLYLLNQVRVSGGSEQPVTVLIDKRVSLDDVVDVDRTAAKAQLKNLRFFMFDPADKSFMTEFKWGASVPFSTNPGRAPR